MYPIFLNIPSRLINGDVFSAQMFFLTAKVLHFGPVNLMQQRTKMARYVGHHEQDVAQLQEALGSCVSCPATLSPLTRYAHIL